MTFTTTVKAVRIFPFQKLEELLRKTVRLLRFFNKEQKEKYYRRLFIFELVEVAQNTGVGLTIALSAAKEFLSLAISPSLTQSFKNVGLEFFE
jgi:hypothetical protein